MLNTFDEVSDTSKAEPEGFDAWLAIGFAAEETAEHGDLADDLAQGGRFRALRYPQLIPHRKRIVVRAVIA